VPAVSDSLDHQPVAASLGERLIAAGKLNAAGLDRAQRLRRESGERLETVLTNLGLVSERDLAETLAVLLDLPLKSSKDFPNAPVFEGRFNRRFLKQARVIPLEDRTDALVVAMADPLDDFAIEALAFAAEKPVLRCVAYPADIDAAYERLYGEGKSEIGEIFESTSERSDETVSDDVDRLKDLASEAPVIRLVNLLITRAVETRASDIHIEPMDGQLRVRYRVDGVLHEVESPPPRLQAAIISRVKIMAKLNIAERRLSQDGRIRLAVRGKDIDFRVSTTPTIHGESVVLRILDRSGLELDFRSLGFEDDLLRVFTDILNRPHGILLVTGPTGSGKTTTLYTSLLTLNTADKKILTIEDPVEYQLKGVNQLQVKPQIGLTFPTALRSFLRQDPDIMMIGEIRDLETAQIAVQAALTGHLILSTLHTNDAPSAITRLLDMGVEDYLLTSTINGVVGQRLVRTLCRHCKEPFEALPEMIERMQFHKVTEQRPIILHRAVGCAQCNGTGFWGRTAILEVLVMSDAVRQLILKQVEARRLRVQAEEEGMQTMHLHGMRKALAGVTTVEEVLRVTGDF
jgi:general secretion pathway protein E